MTVYIILTILTVAIAALVKKQEGGRARAYRPVCARTKGELFARADRGCLFTRQQACNGVCLLFLFVLLFGVSFCRDQVGNDYTRYEEFFHLIPLRQVVPTEFGFNGIVLFMQFLAGRDARISIFGLFAFITVAFMIKAVYDQSEDFLFSFFLFMTLSYYFQSLNTVRYYFAWAIAVFSMKYVLKGQYLKFILLILPAATVHKSVLLVIPVYLLACLPFTWWQLVLLGAAASTGLICQELYLKVIVRLYPSYENTAYLDGGTSLVNIIRISGVFVLSLLYYKKAIAGNKQNRFYFHLNLFALLLYTCASFVPEISRVGYYMTAGHIFLRPSLIARIGEGWQRKFWKIAVIAAAVLYFAIFLIKAQDLLVRIVPYHTWIFPAEISGKAV